MVALENHTSLRRGRLIDEWFSFVCSAQVFEEENNRLEASGESTRSQMEAMAASHDTQRRILEALNAQLLEKIHELTRLQRDIGAALET